MNTLWNSNEFNIIIIVIKLHIQNTSEDTAITILTTCPPVEFGGKSLAPSAVWTWNNIHCCTVSIPSFRTVRHSAILRGSHKLTTASTTQEK